MRDVNFEMLNAPVDVSRDFLRQENTFFSAMRVVDFNTKSACGTLEWKRNVRQPRNSFNQIFLMSEESKGTEFPSYGQNLVLPFSLNWITPRTVRVRIAGKTETPKSLSSLMLARKPGNDKSWKAKSSKEDGRVVYRGKCGSVTVAFDPWHIEFRDATGKLLTHTQHPSDSKCLHNCDPTPFSIVRRASDLGRCVAASFALAPDEKIYGCGESFSRLNKRGQKIVLWTSDALGVQTHEMYKPVPFFISSRGYGMFIHASTPLTLDFGCSYDQGNVIYLGDDALDLFFFIGTPKEILTEYTALTGRSPTPPLWSFGLWMSRITYKSEAETREVAAELRKRRIPCDVIHLDTGWFEQDWQCDYKFSKSRFKNPAKMIRDLKNMGFHISLWQLPYFTPKNDLFRAICDKGLAVRTADGKLPTEDAILDFSNPDTVKFYQDLLAGLLRMGVGAIKVDFGEAAPLNGLYASGKTGFHEHNLYPLRYNKAVAEITKKVTGEWIIWARSAWAGSQRYPLHWGGDAENTDCGMAASLRGGLSFGLCGFSFWSHDIGGFVHTSPKELYRRWMPFGMLTSHSRCHGAPPKEPWPYGKDFTDDFRRAVELKYRLMPYVYAQARSCSGHGWPMLRTLFFEYPDDPASWLIEDEYFFGHDLLVAPLMDETTSRDVYLPPGVWIDYQTGKTYDGPGWYHVEAGRVPVVLFVRDGAVIPHIQLAQSTSQMKWNEIELVVFCARSNAGRGLFALPDDPVLHSLNVHRADGHFTLKPVPVRGSVKWAIRDFSDRQRQR